MGKAADIAGLECSADALVWAVEVLGARIKEIIDLRETALHSDDIEAVHDMRVAIRRLRSTLRDFAPFLRKRPLKDVRRELKDLADALGAVRDLDVSIIALEKLQIKAKSAAIRKGVAKLIEEKQTERAHARLVLAEALDESKIEDLQKNFGEALEKATRRRKKSPEISFTEAGREAVFERVQEFCRLSDSLYTPPDVEKLHRFRIAAKRLRYSIELFTACWGEKIAPFAAQIAELQTFLGEVHDADAWIESLGRRMLEDEKEISPKNLWLLSRFVKIRTKNYRRAIKLWSRWRKEKFIKNLRRTVLSAN